MMILVNIEIRKLLQSLPKNLFRPEIQPKQNDSSYLELG